jgi:sugar/nucleoside kinase (ribokinase family)
MSILVVGSVALDTIKTPFGQADDVLGGSAVFFSAAASLFSPVSVVGVVGADYPRHDLSFLEERGVDLGGLETAPGQSFRWGGTYAYDLNSRETDFTELGVFADFQPRVPDRFRDARFVFLGNIDPVLQLDVLSQVREPRLVVCDTMNYWIHERRHDALLELLSHVDVLMVNDEEARQLADHHNLVVAARRIQERGPAVIVVKKGEHGAVIFGRDAMFFIPGYPLEEVFDPTGAGDAFAGGFMGYLARAGTQEDGDYRRAMVYGSAMGSFAVERFSVDRFRDLDMDQVRDRVAEFREMTTFEHVIPDVES